MSHPVEQTRVAAIYNPQIQTKTQLIEGFVVRQNTFKNLFKVIKEAKMDVPEQHYLLLGRRGMGKTTLLLRLAYEVENDPALNTWLIPLVFNEEEYGIRRLFNFWERIMELLEQKHPDFRFEEAERRQLSAQYKDDDAYERALFDRLAGELTRTGRKLLLFIDNFGDMARKMNDAEAHRLRKILQTSADIRIIAASAVVLESFYQYDHPFYEFFKIQELKGLDAKETRDLLLRLSEHYKKEAVVHTVEKHPGRVEALRRITGGVVRTMVLLFEIFADDEDGSAFKDLEVILDRTTPLYKHRMDDLSDQQQAIVEAIALNWDALSVKEIAERTRLESKIISAQLQNLERNGIVEKISTKTKNHLYIVAERFFNIWYLMRNGRRGDEKRVLWLVRFFEDWCDGDMMKSRAELHVAALQKGGFDPEAALTYSQALSATLKLSAIDQHEFLSETRSFLTIHASNLANELQASDLEVTLLFTLLLAKNEHQWLYDYFTSPEGEAAQLKDRFKPIWYAILKQLDHPDFLRMGEDLAQTVEEVLTKAKQMAVDYA
jgi:DNA polymerase III delta prime subunit